MHQLTQNMSSGETRVEEAPTPKVSANGVLIRTSCTLISAGTERMLVEFGRSSLLNKARKQPERVRQVLEKVKTDGVLNVVDAVRSKLAQPLPLGYCNVGRILEAGRAVDGFAPGDRVVSNGPHADVVSVPKTLAARIPDGVDDEAAAFTVLGAIGLQGIRLAAPTLGEAFVVTGVGLIGLLTVQLLKAQGCRVLAIDFDEEKLALARKFGAQTCNPSRGEDPVAAGLAFSRGNGVDGVIITASTTSSEPVSEAARMCRKRGRIVLVGVAGLNLQRAEFYEKELSFQVSCSYGPGRYDPSYEQAGIDYPIGFVRWTEQRNFEAVLDMMADGRLDTASLVSHRVDFTDAPSAYDILAEDKGGLGILLKYADRPAEELLKRKVSLTPRVMDPAKPVCGFVGAGNYASRVLIPAFKTAGAQLKTVASSGGLSSVVHGRASGFVEATTDTDAIFDDPEVNTVVVVTRHDTHADFVSKALGCGKNVFVEKPLAISMDQLDRVENQWRALPSDSARPHLMVGFNRRFAPQVQKMKAILAPLNEPKSFIMTMNAGAIPANHWTQDPAVGGGRIIGEACHYIDLMRFLAGSEIVSVQARSMGRTEANVLTEDKAAITLGFADGSFGTIHYLANGAAAFPKERVEVFVGGRILQLDNFRKLKGFGWANFRTMNLWKQDKGQAACSAAFLAAIEHGRPTPIPPEEIFEVARVSIQSAELLRQQ
jgi:predicted dehydrogenase/threonine dehydrogenase-like Zn-dependent dehydrogenase